jgi:uncharacterized membrane protein
MTERHPEASGRADQVVARSPCFAGGVNSKTVDERSQRRNAEGENRLPPACAVVVAVVVYALLPSTVLYTDRFIIPAAEVLLLIALLVTNPRRLTRQTRWSRWASVALAALVIVTNIGSLVLLVTQITAQGASGSQLLVAAMQIWLTNVIGFALLYWELDRGGPVQRHSAERRDLPEADWRFSQDENDDAVIEVSRTSSAGSGWISIFIDYLYLSLTNSSAFSPTDTMPLTSRAKMLMGIQATAALLTTLVVVAFAVGSIGQ